MFLSVLNQAWHEFEPNDDAHALIIPLLRPALLWDFGPMYDALCDALMNKGVQPGSVDSYNIRKTESAAAAKIKRAKEQAALAKQLRKFLADGTSGDADFDAAIPMIPMIPDLPQGAASSGGGWRPSGAQGYGGEAMLAQPATSHSPQQGQPQRPDRRGLHPGP